MNFQKKVLVLKSTDCTISQKTLSGLARIEIENGVAEFHLSLVNLSKCSGVEYFIMIIDSNSACFEFFLGKRPSSFAHLFHSVPCLDNGISIGLYSVKDNVPLTIAFASDGKISLNDFKRLITEKYINKRKQDLKLEQEKNQQSTIPSENNDCFLQYNDEAVATENYFDLDKEIQQKLLEVKQKEFINDKCSTENELFNLDGKEKTQEERSIDNYAEDEKGLCECQKSQEQPYYQSVKDELTQLFYKFPKEDNLCNLFKESSWVKINYSKDKFYVVGLIFQDNKEKYICYGVPANYSKTPPKELAGYCSFIPLSVLDMFGKGYWIMFQDAVSGKCVHLER